MSDKRKKQLEEFVFLEKDWFKEKYSGKSRGRFITFKMALNWFIQHGGKNIVETGTTKEFEDWGAGMSTVLFAEVCRRYGGKIWTIDNSEDALGKSKVITMGWSDLITYVLSDSIDALKEFPHKIDFLYLDSMDCPIDPDDDAGPSQRHQLAELEAAYDKLSQQAVVMMDDNGFLNGGKSALSKRWLGEKGWTCLMDAQQTVWVR